MTMSESHATFAAALRALQPAGVFLGSRIIAPGDEDALLEPEVAAFRNSVPKVRRQSGAARIAARQILATLGVPNATLPRSESGAPTWPPGFVGSLAHDAVVAVAAIARADEFAALGIDVEPAVPLPGELIDVVSTPAERRRYTTAILESRLLFVAKEAIYKALHPVDGVFLDFHDIEIDLEARQGTTRSGRCVSIATTLWPRALALAFVTR
jgi:4'-phosphopantetheinyl transferase EntD